jgi:cytochrome b561
VVFALVLVRLWWRFTHPPPEVPMPPLQAKVAGFVHVLIYALLIVNGIAGSIGWILSGDPIVFFGMQVAPARAASPALEHLCVVVGMTTARALVVVIALHVVAVVKHEWLDRDRILERMLPGPPIPVPRQPKAIMQRLRGWRRQRELRASNDASLKRD